ncbi:MAG TPA: RiPP maturation radical SAM protein 1, partial [Thermoanaerobaculia bacterium]|nr:RiPP maturation radical SAM protein 1 [Thermoanaerobaculia bacterium]
LLKACRELGVRLSWNYLWGFPGEEDAWYAETAAWLPALEHLQPPSGVTRVRFDRFSPYHQRPEAFGLTLRPAPAASHVYPLPSEDLLDLTYYFAAAGRPDAFTGDGEITAGRPGIRTIQGLVDSWRTAFWAGEPPALRVEDDGEALACEDTRSRASERRFRLTGLERAVYLAAQDAPLRERLASVLAERQGLAASPEAVEAVAAELERRSLVVTVDRRLLALGLQGPLPDLPSVRDFPGGLVEDGPHQWA